MIASSSNEKQWTLHKYQCTEVKIFRAFTMTARRSMHCISVLGRQDCVLTQTNPNASKLSHFPLISSMWMTTGCVQEIYVPASPKERQHYIYFCGQSANKKGTISQSLPCKYQLWEPKVLFKYSLKNYKLRIQL